MEQTVIKELSHIAQTIYDKKGFNILVLDVRKFSTMTDYYIIAEGNVDRHVKAISQAIADELHQMNNDPLFIEGKQEGDWVVLDYGAFVIHLLISELREKYALEDLWRKGEIVDVVIDTNSSNHKT
jgi:ribosome-associated protein